MSEKPVLVKRFDDPETAKKSFNFKMVIAVFLVCLAGVTSGYFLSLKLGSKEAASLSRDVSTEDIVKGTTVGISDEKTFKDSAEGKLEKGGVNGDGSHHLVRPGGESQNVYLTSSVVDLDKFVGREVKVWGETFSSQKAGWLMDVGKLKVLD